MLTQFILSSKRAKKLAKRKDNEGYKPPTNPETVTFEEFLAARDSAEHQPVESEHIYLQLNSDKRHEFIARDLPFFAPKPSWWMVDYHANKGINCRFGARGIIAETHYDGGRNFVAMLRGSKRWVRHVRVRVRVRVSTEALCPCVVRVRFGICVCVPAHCNTIAYSFDNLRVYLPRPVLIYPFSSILYPSLFPLPSPFPSLPFPLPTQP